MSADPPIFAARRASTEAKLKAFHDEFTRNLGTDATRLADDTCLYVTGSGGRAELSDHSDLDLFLIRASARPPRLDQMVIGAAVVRALAACGFPAPSKDGEFLALHRVDKMLQHMGTPDDDALNLFTARMLLLLESRCVEGQPVYERAIERVLDQYWRNLDKHPGDYLPIILLNDISRYWRIVLLNYEARQNPQHEGQTDPTDEDKAKRRLRSHKLRFSRCLLCYSAIGFLLFKARAGDVQCAAAREMVSMTPTERLLHMKGVVPAGTAAVIDDLLQQYAAFLERMNAGEDSLVLKFQDDVFRRMSAEKGEAFGTRVFELMALLGDGNPLYRYLIV